MASASASSASASRPLFPITNPTSTRHRAQQPSLLSRPFRALAAWTAEAHPHARAPAQLRPHPVELSFYTRRLRRTAALFLPVAVVVFAWPFAARAWIEAGNGVLGYDVADKGRKGARKMARKMGIDDEAWGMKGPER
ncbi:hypothetical protein MBLNU230_g2445t1 [Neophaeotheca triangularis]